MTNINKNWLELPFHKKLEILAKINEGCEKSEAFEKSIMTCIIAAEEFGLITSKYNNDAIEN
jgi:hypothetical protein